MKQFLTVDQSILECLQQIDQSIGQLAVAVSGGSDSLALLYLMHDWSKNSKTTIQVVSVDHQLRQESKQECQFIKQISDELGLLHTTLVWKKTTKKGNLSEIARDARYQLIATWAKSQGVSMICLGHTMDDQAETVLMQIARCAGVDGLSGMPVQSQRFGVNWIRPLLGTKRLQLRKYLYEKNCRWVDDPTNEDSQYTRVKIRKIIPYLKEGGVSIESLASIATNLQHSKQIIDDVVRSVAQNLVSLSELGEYIISNGFWDLRTEIQIKLIAKMVQFMCGEKNPRRASAVRNCIHNIQYNKAGTISNYCVRLLKNEDILFYQTANTIPKKTKACSLWNCRWKATGFGLENCFLGPLEKVGIKEIGSTPNLRWAKDRLVVSPALWDKNEKLLAVYFQNSNPEYQFEDFKSKGKLMEFLNVN